MPDEQVKTRESIVAVLRKGGNVKHISKPKWFQFWKRR